jgi:hypothetical protein
MRPIATARVRISHRDRAVRDPSWRPAWNLADLVAEARAPIDSDRPALPCMGQGNRRIEDECGRASGARQSTTGHASARWIDVINN